LIDRPIDDRGIKNKDHSFSISLPNIKQSSPALYNPISYLFLDDCLKL